MIKKIIAAIRLHRNFHKTKMELSRLTTRELQDIGIDRSMITRISLETARKLSA
jgi:uncharacterized protein YjiS (DUF1127 family)